MHYIPDTRTRAGGGDAQSWTLNGPVQSSASAPENRHGCRKKGDQATAGTGAEPQTYEYPYIPSSSPVPPSYSTSQCRYGSQSQGSQLAVGDCERAYDSQQPTASCTFSSSAAPYRYGSRSRLVQSTAVHPVAHQSNMDFTRTGSSVGARHNKAQNRIRVGHSDQMNRFLDEVAPATVLLTIPGLERKAEERGRRHGDALRRRVRVIEGRVGF
jgi:hypothetical protein